MIYPHGSSVFPRGFNGDIQVKGWASGKLLRRDRRHYRLSGYGRYKNHTCPVSRWDGSIRWSAKSMEDIVQREKSELPQAQRSIRMPVEHRKPSPMHVHRSASHVGTCTHFCGKEYVS